MSASPAITVGRELHRFRTRQGISQFDLAVCMEWKGTNPVIQIEKDRRIPKPDTIERLGQCLGLRYLHIHYLNGLAGHVPPTRLPPAAEIRSTLEQIEPVLAEFPYPAYVFDYQFRLWMANPLALALVRYGGDDAHVQHLLAQPMNALDTVYDTRLGFARMLDDLGAARGGHTFRFKATNSYRQHEAFCLTMPERMQELLLPADYQAFQATWDAIDLFALASGPVHASIDVSEFYARLEHGDLRLRYANHVLPFYMRVESILHLGDLFIIVSLVPVIAPHYPDNREHAAALFSEVIPLWDGGFRLWDMRDIEELIAPES